MTTGSYRAAVDFLGDPATLNVVCDNCEWEGTAEDAIDIGGCSLTPGDPSPAGRCPEEDCGALVYLKDEK